MKKINLKDFYTFYDKDTFVNVDETIADEMEAFKRKESSYLRKLYRYKAHYSLDRNDGINQDITYSSQSPYELYERKITTKALYSALNLLPDIQAKRIYAYYFLDMSKTDIANAEGVSVKAVCNSIDRGLETLGKVLKHNL